MDNLEKFVNEQRDEFDVYEPSEKLWAKIEEEIQPKIVREINWTRILWRAAAIIVMLTSTYVFYVNYSKHNKFQANQNNAQEIIIPELQEAEAYYTSQVNERMQEFNVIAANYPDIKNDVNNDFQELDSICAQLRNDLKDQAANEEVVAALIQNYRLKVDILEDLLKTLKQQQHGNNNKKQYDI